MRFKMKSLKAIFVFFLLNLLCLNCFASENSAYLSVKGFGSSEIKEEGFAEAKNEAVSNAVDAAYKTAVLSVLPEDTVRSDFEKILILLKKEGKNSVQEFQVLGEKISDNILETAVAAKFSKKQIEKLISVHGIVIEKIKLPEVMLLISEKDIEDYDYYQWWKIDESPQFGTTEKAIASELEKSGFKVNHPFVYSKTSDFRFESDVVPDKKDAINIALEKNAEIVVVGKSHAVPGGNKIEGVDTVKVSVSLIVFRTDTGEEVCSISKDIIVKSENGIYKTKEAFEKAGTESGQEITDRLYSYIRSEADKKNEIEIEVSGEGFFPRFISFKKKLISSKIIEDFKEKEISSESSIASVFYKGSSNELAEKIVELPFDGFGVVITDISEKKIKIELVSVD
jgi:hypothetical protein